jgi:hypothetical protein
MKKRNTAKQHATPDQDDRIAVQEPQIKVVANLESGNERVDLYK